MFSIGEFARLGGVSVRPLRRARRLELRVERRLITAWRRAAELRDTAELRGTAQPVDWRLPEHAGLVVPGGLLDDDWQLMRDPAGLVFCVIPEPPGELNDSNARRWD
jgi:hypothetical protein